MWQVSAFELTTNAVGKQNGQTVVPSRDGVLSLWKSVTVYLEGLDTRDMEGLSMEFGARPKMGGRDQL